MLPMTDEARDLELLATMVAIPVMRVLDASVVLAAVRMGFTYQWALYATNPANTFICSAVTALEERSVVALSEIVQRNEEWTGRAPGIRRARDLLMHRHALSHVVKTKWERAWMQAFHDAGRAHFDIRPALVWDLRASIDERLEELGRPQPERSLRVTPEMVAAVLQIMRASYRADACDALPIEADLQRGLAEFAERLRAFWAARPDGQTTPPRATSAT
jgi:hypothetical protein